jgi:hypothetical protein
MGDDKKQCCGKNKLPNHQNLRTIVRSGKEKLDVIT